MAQNRPYVINANVIKLLNSAPVLKMRPNLGSLVQRKTIDIGCYPFPFMVNSDNIPLDGRIVGGKQLETRPVPFWCSENSYAKYPGDSSFNNGKIVWSNKKGFIQSTLEGNNSNLPYSYEYDSALGVTYPVVRINTGFVGMDNTVPREWIGIRDLVLGTPDGLGTSFSEGSTLDIANNVLFQLWSGLTYDGICFAGDPGAGTTYAFFRMENYIQGGGTFSPFFDRYNYGCLDQIFNSPKFANVAIEPNSFWSGGGASYGVSGGLSGEFFLLNAVSGGENSGALYVESYGGFNDPLVQTYILGGISGGNTLSPRNFALNLYSIGSENPYLGANEDVDSFVDTMALLLATNQKFAFLINGQTASLRSLDFNNPCSASFVYREDTDLGKWGYEVQRVPIGEDVFTPAPPPEIGCNINTFVEYINGTTAKQNGIVHPLSWMFWKGVSAGGQVSSYAEGFVHDYVGLDTDGLPVYNKLEGIHDHLCYEYYDSTGLKSRVYYPLRPITSNYYSSKVSGLYNTALPGGSDALLFGNTIDQKYDTAFPDEFKGAGSVNVVSGAISLRNLDQAIGGVDILFPNTTNLNGVTGVMFPYFVPLASFAMQGINDGGVPGGGNLVISGEFDNFSPPNWDKNRFNVEGIDDPQQLYQYYGDGVSSAADFGNANSTPYNVDTSGKPNFRLFSWNALSRISPLEYPHDETSQIIRSSFKNRSADPFGTAIYTNPNTLELEGSGVDVDPLNYPPSALPDVDYKGLTYEIDNGQQRESAALDCESYINTIRYANNINPSESPNPGAFGLTASRKLLANVLLGASVKSFSVFDPDKTIEASNSSQNFTRQGNVANTSTNFFDPRNNFFFTTSSSGDPLAVFDGSYYLTASEYFNKYVNTSSSHTWWENVDIDALAAAAGFDTSFPGSQTIGQDITGKLLFPSDNWVGIPGFRNSQYDFLNDTEGQNGDMIGGVRQALIDGLHPAFVYRLFTTNVIQNLGSIIERSCIETWRSGGVPCHQLPGVMIGLKGNGSIYNRYFQGLTGCSQFGEDYDNTTEFSTKSGKDFFAALAQSNTAFDYIYPNYFYSPFPNDPSNPWSQFQNTSCAGSGSVSDPPTTAALTSFGTQFAEVIKIVEKKTTDLTDPTKVREELFAFRGNTASLNGTNNSLGNTFVSDWLQNKLASIFGYWNDNFGSTDSDFLMVENLLTTLYPLEFPAYKDTLSQSSVYKLWAVKPKCVDEWTPDCSDLATNLRGTNDFRRGFFPSRNSLFRDEDFNSAIPPSERSIRPGIVDLQQPVGNNSTILTSNDIIPSNEGFIGAFRTLYIEPLGLATRVLATEAQAVSRATISSTVLGKITTIIDSNGFIRDVNQITFESGSGIKILGDNDTGNISFSITGITLGSLEDVAIDSPLDENILIYDGELGKWINRPFHSVLEPYLIGLTAEPNFFYQETPPDTGVTLGTRWMDSNTGIEYIYIMDGDSDQWVQASN